MNLFKLKIPIKKSLLLINLKIFKNIFFFLSISYFIYHLINYFRLKISLLDFENLSILLLFSLFSCILSIFFNGLAWKDIIIWFGTQKKIDNLLRFYLLTNSLKYVPGSVWHFVERFNFLKNKTNKNFAFYGILIEPYFMLCSALILTSIGVFYNPLFLLFLLPSIFLHRDLIYFIIIKMESIKSTGVKMFKITNTKSKFDSMININSSFPFRIIFIEMLFILFKFIGFILCFHIFNTGNDFDYLYIFIIFCLSWSVGLIIPVAPGGLGIFEASFLLFSGNTYSYNNLLISLIVFRFISSSADILLSAPFLIKKLIRGN